MWHQFLGPGLNNGFAAFTASRALSLAAVASRLARIFAFSFSAAESLGATGAILALVPLAAPPLPVALTGRLIAR